MASVEPDELARLMSDTDLVVIDVRESIEADTGCIPDAVCVRVSELPPVVDSSADGWLVCDRPVAVCCEDGQRSARVARTLRHRGCCPVVHLRGGLQAWREAGFAVVEAG